MAAGACGVLTAISDTQRPMENHACARGWVPYGKGLHRRVSMHRPHNFTN